MVAVTTIRATNSASGTSVTETLYTTVSTKGQVVIPAAIRHELGIEPGTRLAMRVEGGRVVVDADNIESRLRRIEALRGLTAGAPSMADELIEERRRDLERETAEGW
jgi:AbrB family looped-hinge helix DNA binding protein